MQKRPNILLIMTDQQRPDSLGCYGSPIAMTPNLDQLASEGVVFDNCYVQNPLCCPSRYSILTGRYPHNHGVVSNWYAPRAGERSFGHQLKRAGYSTALIGKMHLTPWNDCFGFDGRIIAEAKFDVNCPDDYEKYLNKHGTSRKDLYNLTSAEYVQNISAVKSKVPQELHIDSFVGMSICEYLLQAEEPFCLFGSFLSPHNPYDPPAPYDQLFHDQVFPERNMRENELELKPQEAYDYINNRLKWPQKTDQLTEKQLNISKAYYYSLNTLVDDWIGKIIATLKQTGHYNDTIIIYTSDHGDMLGDHGLVYKQCFYEQSVKAPLVIHSPSRFLPHRVSSLVESIDIFNTICEFGAAWPGYAAQGKSLAPLLEKRKDYIHREAVFSENYFGKMVRYQDYKMVFYPGKPYGELYNLDQDPDEQNNLWVTLEGSPVKNKMKDLLLDWIFTSEEKMQAPVRKDHFDTSPRQYESYEGGTREAIVQPWYLNNLITLYEDWDFKEPRKLRE